MQGVAYGPVFEEPPTGLIVVGLGPCCPTTRLNLAGLRCIAVSYRGNGGSDSATGGYTHARFARDIFTVADAVGARRFVMAGFSMAGKFGRYLACLSPERVLGQILIAPVGPETLEFPRPALDPWLEAAPFPERFREVLIPFTKLPIREDLLDLYCRNVSLASRGGLEGTIDMFYESIEREVSRGQHAHADHSRRGRSLIQCRLC